jgi:hypothetical protein
MADNGLNFAYTQVEQETNPANGYRKITTQKRRVKNRFRDAQVIAPFDSVAHVNGGKSITGGIIFGLDLLDKMGAKMVLPVLNIDEIGCTPVSVCPDYRQGYIGPSGLLMKNAPSEFRYFDKNGLLGKVVDILPDDAHLRWLDQSASVVGLLKTMLGETVHPENLGFGFPQRSLR